MTHPAADSLIINGSTPRPIIIDLYGYVHIIDEGLKNLCLCSALTAYKQGEIFVVPHLLWYGNLVFAFSSK
jgi:hypothetical protein